MKRIIMTKFHGPTNTRGSRYSARSGEYRVMMGADHSMISDRNHERVAREIFQRLQAASEIELAMHGPFEDRLNPRGYFYFVMPAEET